VSGQPIDPGTGEEYHVSEPPRLFQGFGPWTIAPGARPSCDLPTVIGPPEEELIDPPVKPDVTVFPNAGVVSILV
jgi:hypothetical protein